MCYFKRVENTLKMCMRQLKTAEESEKTVLKQQVALLQDILAYIKQGSWTDSKKSYERIMYTLKNGVTAAAEKYETTQNCIYAGLSKAAMRVQALVGKEVLELLGSGDVEYARFLFLRNTKQLSGMLLDNVVEDLPINNSIAEISLEDCVTELKHLRVYTPWFVEKVMADKCDKDKLAYIRQLLTTKDGAYTKQQFELYRKLKNTVSG